MILFVGRGRRFLSIVVENNKVFKWGWFCFGMARVDVSVISRDLRADMIRLYRKHGFSNAQIRHFMEEAEGEWIDRKIGALRASDLDYFEQLKFGRPYAVAKMVRELRISPERAGKHYDLFVAQEELNLELGNAGDGDGKRSFVSVSGLRGAGDDVPEEWTLEHYAFVRQDLYPDAQA